MCQESLSIVSGGSRRQYASGAKFKVSSDFFTIRGGTLYLLRVVIAMTLCTSSVVTKDEPHTNRF
jgi:hypothetical protein